MPRGNVPEDGPSVAHQLSFHAGKKRTHPYRRESLSALADVNAYGQNTLPSILETTFGRRGAPAEVTPNRSRDCLSCANPGNQDRSGPTS